MNTERRPEGVEIRDVGLRQEAQNSAIVGTMIENMSLDARRSQRLTWWAYVIKPTIYGTFEIRVAAVRKVDDTSYDVE